MALIVSDTVAVPAAVFTTNQIKAAPVKWDIKVVEHDGAQAIVINSGNANACTGEQGKADTHAMAALTAGLLKTTPDKVFVCSTGTIGKPLPMDKIVDGIETLVDSLSPDNGMDAAKAILTTDLVTKTITSEIEIDGHPIRLTGIAKGSGMIEPNMATMLAFILTDANVDKHSLQCALRAATETSFNRITVDGDQSTNDSVIVLANGHAGNELLTQDSNGWDTFFHAMKTMLFEMAMMILRDGEGVTKLVTIRVIGAASNGEANEAAQAVANSMLNKTAWKGSRPNWGRIMDAVGYSHAQVQEERIDITYDAVPAVRGGMVYSEYSEKDASAVVSQKEFTIHINLNIGSGEAIVYSCDFTEDYVRINEK